MDGTFTDEMKKKSDKELKDIVLNFQLYRGALTAAAKNELALRGIELSDDEKQIIENTKKRRRQDAIENQGTRKTRNFFNINWKQNIVTDGNAPELYSRQVINAFSILFSVLVGGILLAINLNTVNNKKAILPVLLYSVFYTALTVVILNLLPGGKSALSIALNLAGAIVLYNYFWGKYIGKELQYRTKSFWIPLIIVILMIFPLIMLIIAGI